MPDSMFPKLDTYTIHARLATVILVIMPLVVSTFAVINPEKIVGRDLSLSITIWLSMSLLFSQLGRDQGKKKETKLFEWWGGPPTIRYLRHRDSPLDHITLKRYHQKLSMLIPGIKIPTAEEEAVDPKQADEIYKSCINYLKEATRNKDKFPLVFAENVSYGFRRNFWAMKSAGLMFTLLSLALLLAVVIIDQPFTNFATPYILLTAFFINIFMLVLWILRINQNWVRLAAEAYAERLLAACDQL